MGDFFEPAPRRMPPHPQKPMRGHESTDRMVQSRVCPMSRYSLGWRSFAQLAQRFADNLDLPLYRPAKPASPR